MESEEWDVVDLKVTSLGRNERVVCSIAAELVLPMCVVGGLLEVTTGHIFFNPEGFTGDDGDHKLEYLAQRRWKIAGLG